MQNFSADISAMSVDEAFTGQPCQALSKVICEHLFRQGKMEVGEALMQVHYSLCVQVHVSMATFSSVSVYRRQSLNLTPPTWISSQNSITYWRRCALGMWSLP